MKAINLYNLQLHQTGSYDFVQVTRVPGGWIYKRADGLVFVPFNNEFQTEEPTNKTPIRIWVDENIEPIRYDNNWSSVDRSSLTRLKNALIGNYDFIEDVTSANLKKARNVGKEVIDLWEKIDLIILEFKHAKK